MITIFGFIFWAINTRLFSPEEVGLASALLAAVELLVMTSLLGFDVSLIRFIPKSPSKKEIINSSFSLSGIAALVTSIIFILGIEFFSPELIFIRSKYFGVLFIIFVIFSTFFQVLTFIFIALRKSRLVFVKNLIFSTLKIIFPFILIAFGAYGIFSSWGIAIIIAFIICLYFLKQTPRFRINLKVIKSMYKFSFVNYISNFLHMAPGLIIPLMIVNLINAETTAYFYIDWMIASVLFVIPMSISRSFLAESSRGEDCLKRNVRKSIGFSIIVLLPAVVITVFLSKYLLLFFGAEYSQNAFRLLQILAISSIPFAINYINITMQNVKHKLRIVLLVHLASAVGILSLSFFLLHLGIIYIGLSWLFTQTVLACVSAFQILRCIKSE